MPQVSVNFAQNYWGYALAPTLDQVGLDICGFDQIGGLVSPSDFTSSQNGPVCRGRELQATEDDLCAEKLIQLVPKGVVE